MQARPTPRVHIPYRRQRSRSPDPIVTGSSTLFSELDGGQAPPPTPVHNKYSKRSKKRENQYPGNSSSTHNHSRGSQNDADAGPVARGDKPKVKSMSSKHRHTTNQSTETSSSARTAIQGRRDRDRSLTRGESSRSSKQTPTVEPIDAADDPQLTGPIAVAHYMRLQIEVEKLREVGSKHVMIGTIRFGFTHLHSNYKGQRRQSISKAKSSMS